VDVLRTFHLPSIAAAEKAAMIDRILQGGPWTPEEQAAILAYCMSDAMALTHLLPLMLPHIALPQALQRGRYLRNVAVVEQRGIPIDTTLRQTLMAYQEPIQDALIAGVNPSIGYAYDGRHLRMDRLTAWVDQLDFDWPRTPKRCDPCTDDDTLEMLALLHPGIEPFRQLLKTLRQMRSLIEKVGHDGYNRPELRPFSAVTSRNLPRTKENVLGSAAWLRTLIQPPPGYGIAYVDWSSQEYGIVAVFADDTAMQEGYRTDPYLHFGKRIGIIPPWGTKETHPAERTMCKACSLGVLYGMGAKALAQRIGKSHATGQRLLTQHQQTYRNFWGWTDRVVKLARHDKQIATVLGWTLHWDPHNAGADCPPVTAGTIKNFPAQSHGAEMLRLALSFAVEAGVEIVAPLHDALLLQAPLAELDDAIHATQHAMEDASEVILRGFKLRTEVQVFRHPLHYQDSRGKAMWKIVRPLLPASVQID
jgi:hypothetical protein